MSIVQNPEPVYGKDAISVVLACDDSFIPHAAQVIVSLLEHANPEKKYDIFVLGVFSSMRSRRITELGGKYPNASIRVLDLWSYFSERSFHVSGHISAATYYRLFLPALFTNYDKMLYLDSDVTVLGDVSSLFGMDMGDSLIAGVPLFKIMNPEESHKEFQEYLWNDLGIADINEYVNAGILLMNLKAMQSHQTFDKSLEALRNIPTPRVHDQDIINSVCNGRKYLLDMSWNFPEILLHVINHYELAEKCAISVWDSIIHYSKNIKILHYLSALKPWSTAYRGSYGSVYWSELAKTMFFDDVFEMVSHAVTPFQLKTEYSEMKKGQYLRFLKSIFSKNRRKHRIKYLKCKNEIEHTKYILENYRDYFTGSMNKIMEEGLM